MKSYAVLKPKYTEHAERSAKLVSDHWRVLAFLVPTFWLIYYRLWLQLTAWLALSIGIFLLPIAWAVSAYLLAGLARYWIALEGPRWYIAKLERNGWQMDGVIEATDNEHAEWLFAQSHNADYAAGEMVRTPQNPTKVRPVKPQASFDLMDISGSQKA